MAVEVPVITVRSEAMSFSNDYSGQLGEFSVGGYR